MLKISVAVCTYHTDTGIVNVDLAEVLGRLDILPRETEWGVDYNITKLIQWNIDNTLRVRYRPMYRFIKDIQELPFGYSSDHDSIRKLTDSMNDIHDRLCMLMTDEEAELKLRKMGNDYTKQIKGEL